MMMLEYGYPMFIYMDFNSSQFLIKGYLEFNELWQHLTIDTQNSIVIYIYVIFTSENLIYILYFFSTFGKKKICVRYGFACPKQDCHEFACSLKEFACSLKDIEIGFVVFTKNCTCGFYHH